MVPPGAPARRRQGVRRQEGLAVLERERSRTASGELRIRRSGRARSGLERGSAEGAGRRIRPLLAGGDANARDFRAGGGVRGGVIVFVVPARAATTLEV